MKVLVVGGAGYLGGALTDLLLKSSHELKVYDVLLYEEVYRKNADFILGDVRDSAKLKPILDWADVVVWLAAIVGDGASSLNPDPSEKVNDTSVQWLSKNFNKKIIFTSTCSVYGASDEIVNEDSPLSPLSLYASLKMSAENHLKNKDSIVFRLGTLYGLGDSFSRIRMDLVVNSLSAQAAVKGKLKINGGDQYRPLIHVRDAAYAISEAISSDKKGIYNISHENLKIIEIADTVKKIFPKAVIEKTSIDGSDERNYKVSSKKAENDLGFKPKLKVEDGIFEIKNLLEESRILDIDNPRFSNEKHLSHMKEFLKKL